MRIYIRFTEIVEVSPDWQMSDEIPPATAGEVDVTDMTEAEVQQVIADIEDLLEGKSYKIERHICYHDEDPTIPCRIELVKEVRMG